MTSTHPAARRRLISRMRLSPELKAIGFDQVRLNAWADWADGTCKQLAAMYTSTEFARFAESLTPVSAGKRGRR